MRKGAYTIIITNIVAILAVLVAAATLRDVALYHVVCAAAVFVATLVTVFTHIVVKG